MIHDIILAFPFGLMLAILIMVLIDPALAVWERIKKALNKPYDWEKDRGLRLAGDKNNHGKSAIPQIRRVRH